MDNRFFDTSVFVLSSEQLTALFPYLWLCLGMAAATIFAGYRGSRSVGRALALVFFGVYAILLSLNMNAGSISLFGTSLEIDPLAKIVGIATAVFALLVSFFSFEEDSRTRRSEWLLLLMSAVFGLSLLPAARDLVSFFVYLETLAISGYILAGLDTRRPQSLEAGIKYLLMGAFSSAILLMGFTLLFGFAGSFDYQAIYLAILGLQEGSDSALAAAGAILVVTSLLFKVAIFPLHMWAPDVYQAAPIGNAAFLATATKVSVFASLAILMNRSGLLLIPSVKEFVQLLAIFSIVGGSCLAFSQRSLRRMFAYSGIVNAGYSALGIAVGIMATGAVITNLIIYGATLICLFSMIQYFLGKLNLNLNSDCSIEDLAIAAKRSSPIALAVFAFGIFSLAGIPPLPGFFGKYLLLRDMWLSGSTLSAGFVLVGTLMGLAYYLRVFIPIYLDSKGSQADKEMVPKVGIQGLNYFVAFLALIVSALVLGGLNRLPHWVQSIEGFAR